MNTKKELMGAIYTRRGAHYIHQALAKHYDLKVIDLEEPTK